MAPEIDGMGFAVFCFICEAQVIIFLTTRDVNPNRDARVILIKHKITTERVHTSTLKRRHKDGSFIIVWTHINGSQERDLKTTGTQNINGPNPALVKSKTVSSMLEPPCLVNTRNTPNPETA